MREENQFRNIIGTLEKYFAASKENKYLPLHRFLKNHFRENPKFGSSDRRITSDMLYNYFRLGKILSKNKTEERMAIGSFIGENENSPLLEYILSSHTTLQVSDLTKTSDEKLRIVRNHYPEFDLHGLFPFQNYLSDKIDKEKFYKSFFIQPKLWIRLNVGAENFLPLLEKENISFQINYEEPSAISFPNKTSLDKWKDKGIFEIQDLSSQLSGKYFLPNDNEHWWDCCAGSGGKSLLLMDQNFSVKILATDNRESILRNAEFRMKNVGFKNISTQLIDLISSFQFPVSNSQFDGIIADVPCSGSGTWARTPEMLSQFSIEEIEHYQKLQMRIVKNIISYLKKDKPLIYITCSVFKKENEDVVNFLVNECKMKLEKMEYIKGYDKEADTMFVARLIKQGD